MLNHLRWCSDTQKFYKFISPRFYLDPEMPTLDHIPQHINKDFKTFWIKIDGKGFRNYGQRENLEGKVNNY